MAVSNSNNLTVMLVLLYVGYFVTVYVRQSVSFASPVIMETENLKNSDIGLILSSQMTGYMLVKFIGGTLVDVVDPAITFTVSLFLAGVAAASFTAFSSVSMFAFLWFLCGMAQGPAWAACGVMLKKSIPPEKLATVWSFLSTSMNVAGSVGPIISALLVKSHGWRMSLLLSSSISIGLSAVCLVMLKSSPRSKDKNEGKDDEKDEKSGSFRDLFTPVPVLIYLLYMLTTVVRGACNDWGQHYLIQNKAQSIETGGSFISSSEVGGIVGSIVTGYISDYFVSKSSGRTTPRLTLIFFLTLVQTAALYLFVFHVSTTSSQIWINLLSFCIGFGMYSNIALLGICSMEVSPDHLSGTAHSMAALGGNVGRILAGYPLSLVATQWSWQESFFVALVVSFMCIIVAALGRKCLSDRYQVEKLKSS